MSTFSPRSSFVTMRTAGAPGADAGADGVDVGVVGPDGDLGAVAGLAGGGLDLDDAAADLGDLELEQALDEAGVGAADDDLRALGGLADLDDVRLEAGAVLVALVGDLLGLGQEGLDLAEVEQRVAVVGLLDDAGDDVALSAGVLLVLLVALGLPDALAHHLLGGLGGDAAEGGLVLLDLELLAHGLAVLVELLGPDVVLAGVGIDVDPAVLPGTGHALVGRLEGVGERLEQRLDRDAPELRDLLHRVEHVGVVGSHEVVAFFVFCGFVGVFLGVGPHSKMVLAFSMSS